MKYIIAIVFVFGSFSIKAQTNINKSYTAKAGQKLVLKFDYPKLIKITTWDKNEIAVNAKVSINGGEHDGAFVLEEKDENGNIHIAGKIKDMDEIPRRYIVNSGGEKIVFKSREALKAYMSEKSSSIWGVENSKGDKEVNVNAGGDKNKKNNNSSTEKNDKNITVNVMGDKSNWDYWGSNIDIDIVVEIFVPANMETELTSTYGMVELKNFKAPVKITALYGGIDASVAEQQTGSISATTRYGKIYSNLNLKITDAEEKDFYTAIKATLGSGPAYNFSSTYGKVYLRKQ